MTPNEKLVHELIEAFSAQLDEPILGGLEVKRRRTFFSPKQIDLVGFKRGAAKGELTFTLKDGKKVEVHVEIGLN